jgi:dihydroxyacetone kinase
MRPGVQFVGEDGLMTHVFNEPTTFARDHLRGFALLHSDLLMQVPGGVVRADRPAEPSVAVVTGGGSGHYPAFCGWVGPGMADAAAVGDVFASPSAEQIVSVCRAADNGRGVLVTYGNYAGDVLNFTEAQHRLEAEGIAVRNLPITDDVTSGPPSARHLRRGTCGDLVVVKVAGAAAAAGYDLEAVGRVAERANARTFSFGIAFGGCTLPGAARPLFEVQTGIMGVGMGVHGEPGISEEPIPSAAELARLLVERLLTERPVDAGPRVIVLLNGLGATKYEELFLLWGEVHDRLVGAGLEIVEPAVDELMTSLNMAGLSLTLCWPDAELEELWMAPGTSAGFSRGSIATRGAKREVKTAGGPGELRRSTSSGGRAQAGMLAGVADAVLEALRAAQDELGALDAVAGDGDHGLGMVRGADAAASAAHRAADAGAGPATTLREAGAAWAARGGGTAGALWGAALSAAADSLDDDRPVIEADVVVAVTAARDALVRVGGAELGDKTMLDALTPFVETLASRLGTDGLAGAWKVASRAAADAAAATASLQARRGRARPHGARSLGHPDPGATSLALVVTTIGARAGEAEGH